MKADAILQAELLDIIFENRNKHYGAYTLRKSYNDRLKKAIAWVFVIIILLSALTFFTEKNTIEKFLTTETYWAQPPAPPVQKPPTLKTRNYSPKPHVTEKATTQALPHNIVIKKDVADDIADLKEDVPSGSQTTFGAPGSQATEKDESNKGSANTAVVSVAPYVDNISPRNTAEIMPAYPGGMEALRKFLARNLNTPQDLNEGQNVSVKIKFIVGFDGVLRGFETAEDGGSAFNNEVIRVLKKMPKWIPGKSGGENVSVYFLIPVIFTSSQQP